MKTNHGTLKHKSNSLKTGLSYALLVLAAIIAPLCLDRINIPLMAVPNSLKTSRYIQLFTCTATIALFLIVYSEFRKRRTESFAGLVAVLVPLLVFLNFFVLFYEFSRRSWDYECYELAAKAVISGENPYAAEEYPYLYPPFTARAMALEYRAIKAISPASQNDKAGDPAWDVVFYLFQCCQFLSIVAVYFLCLYLLRVAGANEANASLVTGAVLIFNAPLMMTLKTNQVNLWVTALALYAICYSRSRPIFSGIALALGAHIKLYPFILLVPLALKKRFGVVAASLAAFVIIALIQTSPGRTWTLWRQFIVSFNPFSEGHVAGANSLNTVVTNTLKAFSKITGTGRLYLEPVVSATVFLLILLIITWFIYRYIGRERAQVLKYTALEGGAGLSGETFKYFSHAIDALTLALIISPTVWHHHYVLAIPIVLWAIATCPRQKLRLVVILSIFILCVPTFSAFPLCYHKLAALLLLVYFCRFDETPSINLAAEPWAGRADTVPLPPD